MGVPVISQVVLSITKPVGREGLTLQVLGVPVRAASPLVPMEASLVRSSTLAVALAASLYDSTVGAVTMASEMVSDTDPAILVAVMM